MIHRICVLDWDDTLVCSTWLKQIEATLGESAIEAIRSSLSTLENLVCGLIDTILQLDYRLYIVTNSETGWVEMSSERFMPTVLTKLVNHKIPIISARDLYAQKVGIDAVDLNIPAPWKTDVFHQLVQPFQPIDSPVRINDVKALGESIYELCGFIPSKPSSLSFLFELPSNSTVELLVVGDSVLDVWAAQSVNALGWIRLKLVKLLEVPDLWTLLREMTHVLGQLKGLSGIENEVSLSIIRGQQGELLSQYQALSETRIDCFFQSPDPDAPMEADVSSPSSTLPRSDILSVTV
jgi:hypothetical protein